MAVWKIFTSAAMSKMDSIEMVLYYKGEFKRRVSKRYYKLKGKRMKGDKEEAEED